MKKKPKLIKCHKIEKLTWCEFYDVYGISLILEKDPTNRYCQSRLLELADKYIKITNYALRCELRHFIDGGYCGHRRSKGYYVEDLNNFVLQKLGLKVNWSRKRLKLTSSQAWMLFLKGTWAYSYGGRKWGKIARACEELESARRYSSYKLILERIDRLNDLEHNNALYLKDHTTFDIQEHLTRKAIANPLQIFDNCHSDIKDIGKELYDSRIREYATA
jgi:hypothetical protein